jgi:DmsE family decaheme c-type cytochrome
LTVSAILLAAAPRQDPPKPEPQKPDASKTQPAQVPAPAAAAEYVGSETCAGCHDDITSNFPKNPHSTLETDKRRKWDGKACEACHGPGSKHVESNEVKDIRSPLRMSAPAVDTLCLNCHKNQRTMAGMLQGGHARNATPCTSCHNVHKTGAESSHQIQKTAPGINKQCGSCHQAAMASFQRPHAHRINEGAMACTGCHNPHGSFLNRNLRLANGNEPGCMKCHSDKRGPFVFEHAPVRNEPCTTCHEPHGSVNPRMLTRHEVHLQCLECHSNIQSPAPQSGVIGGIPPAIHDLRSARYRNCTICHTKVHGSHVSRGLLR